MASFLFDLAGASFSVTQEMLDYFDGSKIYCEALNNYC